MSDIRKAAADKNESSAPRHDFSQGYGGAHGLQSAQTTREVSGANSTEYKREKPAGVTASEPKGGGLQNAARAGRIDLK